MDVSIISALAALTGAAVGGLTSGVATWLNHRSQVHVEWTLHEKSRRQILYKDFIEEASKCCIDAGISSKTLVRRAEEVARKILDTYLEPDKRFVELREMAIEGTIDLLRGFSDACRDEFEEMQAKQFLPFRRYGASIFVARPQSRSEFSGSRA